MKELNKTGVHLHKRQAEPLTPEHENTLWETGVFNFISGCGLQNAVYFYTSKVYGLRAIDEHYNLSCEQFIFGNDTIGHYIKYEAKIIRGVWPLQGEFNSRTLSNILKMITHVVTWRWWDYICRLWAMKAGSTEGPWQVPTLVIWDTPGRGWAFINSKHISRGWWEKQGSKGTSLAILGR